MTKIKFLYLCLVCLFFVSGFCGLIYESIWSHYLKLLLGHAAYSQTLVLSIYMGGMAIGAFLVSRITDKIREPLKVYAIIEGIIGIFGVFFHDSFIGLLDALFNHIVPNINSYAISSLVKWVLSSLLVLPQSILLGATFPLMAAGIIRINKEKSGETLGILYFSNSLGAAIGVLISAFFLLQHFGLPGTTLTAGILNIFVAAIAWLIASSMNPNPEKSIKLGDDQHSDFENGKSNSILYFAFCTGVASFFYEIGWIRMLNLVLGTTMQAFELMLSAFILGLAFGGLWIKLKIKNIKNPIRYVAFVQILMGLTAAATLPLYNSTFDIMGLLISGLQKSNEGYMLFNLSSHVIALAIMLPATFFAGMTLPLFTYLVLRKGEASIGRIYAANTVGAIFGILAAVHIILPMMGIKWLISIGAMIDIGIGMFILFRLSPVIEKKQLDSKVVIVICVTLASTILMTQFDPLKIASGVYRQGKVSLAKDTIIEFHKEGKTSSIDFYSTADGLTKTISTNGKPDASIYINNNKHTADETTMVIAAALPLLLKPDSKQVANIGLGSGLTTHALLGTSRIQQVDTIEIEEAMVEGAKHFGQSVSRAFDDNRSAIYIEDAKTFFSNHARTYDIIISEPSNPWVSGVASLFTVEFYARIKRYMNDDSIFVQWLQIYEISPEVLSSVFLALSSEFEDYVIYNSDQANMIILAKKQGKFTSLDPWIFNEPEMNSILKKIEVTSIDDFTVRKIGDKKIMSPLFASYAAPINSDYYPYLSFNAPKSRYMQQHAVDITYLLTAPVPYIRILENKVINSQVGLPASGDYFINGHIITTHAIHDILVKHTSDYTRIKNEKLQYSVNLVQLSLQNCGNLNINEKLLDDAIFTLASYVNPYLDTERSNQIWDLFANNACQSSLSESTRNWLALYQAVTNSNLNKMYSLASSTLSQGTDLTQSQLRYAILAGVSAGLANGSPDHAKAILQAASNKYVYKENEPLYMRHIIQLVRLYK